MLMRKLLPPLLLVVCGVAGAEEVKIYRSFTAADRVPLYTHGPVNKTSREVALLERQGNERRSRRQGKASLILASRRAELEPLVQRTALRHGIHPALLKAVIEVESGFNAAARSPKGALGLMQVMPATAARYGKFDLHSPEQNLDVGARYLRDLLRMFEGSVMLALAAYNAGENAVIRNGRQIPPYRETMKYVPAVLERYRRYLQQG